MNVFGLHLCEYAGNALRAVASAAKTTALGDLLVSATSVVRTQPGACLASMGRFLQSRSDPFNDSDVHSRVISRVTTQVAR